jgi:beta-glucosidase
VTDPGSGADGRHEDRLDALGLDERAALTAGVDDWHTMALPEHGVPALKVADGPSGVRGESYTSTRSASFPCGTALAATFDPELVERVGAAIADEARTKAAHAVLGPTLNLIRHPLGGRDFETFGEDALLAGAIGAAWVRGVQSRGVAACPKHLVANDVEIERLTVSSDVAERVLREVYLLPFEAALVHGGAWMVMASYNRVNGVHACEDPWLLRQVLRDEWGFDGLVVSDWFATTSTVTSSVAGLDLEMPGPPRHLGPALAQAVRDGLVDADVVAEQARHVLRTLDRVGAGPGPEPPETSVDDPERWDLARSVAAAATVVLRNEVVAGSPLLPLDPGVRRIAVLGPNAAVAVVQGGGSARVTPHRTVSPLAGLRARLGPGVEVVHLPGTVRGPGLPVLDGRSACAGDAPGVRLEYSAADGGPVLDAVVVDRLDPIWSGRFSPHVDPVRFHVRATATVEVERDGPHTFGITSVGPCTVHLDGRLVLDNQEPEPGTSFFGYGSAEVRATVDLRAGSRHELVVEYARPLDQPMGALRLGLQPPLGDDPIGAAAALAAGADVAVIVVGTDEDIERESEDRTVFGLTGDQDELVRRVVAANPRTIVVVNAGGPVDLPWADDVPAIVWSWFGGMGLGEALAAVLVGDVEPAGRLPFTVPRALRDAPCDITATDPPGHLRYEEGLLVGHRWYATQGIAPRWWFGDGLGYAALAWGDPDAPAAWSPGAFFPVDVEVANPGPRDGVAVVQVYLRRPASTLERPAWVLGGFTSAAVPAGATRTVRVAIDHTALRHWDDDAQEWSVEPGPLEVRVARSAGDPGVLLAVDVI